MIQRNFGKGLSQLKSFIFELKDFTNFPRDKLCNLDYNAWIDRFKNYLLTPFFKEFLNRDKACINALNSILSFANIQITEAIPDDESYSGMDFPDALLANLSEVFDHP